MTDGRMGRPLKYETTRPISNRRRPISGKVNTRPRIQSAPARRAAPATITKKDLHRKSSIDNGDDNYQSQDDYCNEAPVADVNEVAKANGAQDGENEDDEKVEQKPPISVKVKKGHPMDKFVEDLRLMNEMELDFKKQTLDLQKKLGLETSGIIY